MKYAMLAALALVLSFNPALAQSKIAYIDSDRVMASIPHVQRSSAKIEAEFKDAFAEIERIEQDLRYKLDKQIRDASFMSHNERIELESDIATLRRDHDTKTNIVQMTHGQRRNEELEIVNNLIRAAAEAERVARGYDMVISSKSVIAAAPLYNLTAPVAARLQAQE